MMILQLQQNIIEDKAEIQDTNASESVYTFAINENQNMLTNEEEHVSTGENNNGNQLPRKSTRNHGPNVRYAEYIMQELMGTKMEMNTITIY